MNDIKRLRLQKQIFRLVATYYQKMARGTGSSRASEGHEVPPFVARGTGGSVVSEEQEASVQNPFQAFDAERFTEQVSDYCTFTRCELSSDGSYAKVFVSIWGDAKEQERILNDIKRHAHGMRSSIAKHIRMRAIPHLSFVQDQSFERGAQIDRLIP